MTQKTASGNAVKAAVKAGPEQALPSTGGSGGQAQFNPEMAAQTFDFRGHGIFDGEVKLPGFGGAWAMVLANVTEFSPVTDKPILGSAVVTLHNVAPQDGGWVKVRMEARWPEDLSIRVQFMWFL
ncbi:hypothetical protein Snoj_55940 [Streptomyces nojiriensis]|uniref:Uncharacterized protein n=1 Tax=Streptomyces nojiriensis TaxID=66374 RepID=A0ABQ3SU58_9ACTN|nr:hypothetical protein [Streptomyces nojiriensis]QTI45219.1 hypothetical protein JYK04_03002 [Streptomyces nojiriensis]GGS36407.1 hypothetical protein GCM10010205_78080 [Streptomyces nojiriensis]GHI71676.1 hypothetical protein Snoj_55940 [Streptomyces nojiriensis]